LKYADAFGASVSVAGFEKAINFVPEKPYPDITQVSVT
jgi:hypothetical protein